MALKTASAPKGVKTTKSIKSNLLDLYLKKIFVGTAKSPHFGDRIKYTSIQDYHFQEPEMSIYILHVEDLILTLARTVDNLFGKKIFPRS